MASPESIPGFRLVYAGKTKGTSGGTQHFVATPSELEARWRAPAFTKDILRIVGIRKLDFSTPFHAIMLCPQLPALSDGLPQRVV